MLMLSREGRELLSQRQILGAPYLMTLGGRVVATGNIQIFELSKATTIASTETDLE